MTRRVSRRQLATRFDLTDRPGFLTAERAREIADALVHHDQRFACHNAHAQHCAGALLLLDAVGSPNLNPRIAIVCGLLDPARLDRRAPVFTDAFVAHHAAAHPAHAAPSPRRTDHEDDAT